jgi:hypothetical protein
MGHRTSISDYEMDRAWTVGPEAEGVDIEASKGGNVPKEHMSESEIRGDFESVTKSKVVESEKKPEPKKSTARTKAK